MRKGDKYKKLSHSSPLLATALNSLQVKAESVAAIECKQCSLLRTSTAKVVNKRGLAWHIAPKRRQVLLLLLQRRRQQRRRQYA